MPNAVFTADGQAIVIRWVFFIMQKQIEVWKDIQELNGIYQISNHGNVRKNNNPRNLQHNGNGYIQLYAQVNKKRTVFYIHRLVGIYFVPNPNNKPEINHIDGNKANNYYENIEWVTHMENIQHAVTNGFINKKGEKHHGCKLDSNKVLAIKRLHRINPNFNRSAIGRKLGVRDTIICKIVNGKRWQHLSL